MPKGGAAAGAGGEPGWWDRLPGIPVTGRAAPSRGPGLPWSGRAKEKIKILYVLIRDISKANVF